LEKKFCYLCNILKYTINQHISQLLYRHECVVVPGFGAFLTRSYPAELNRSINMLRPAWRQVVFNGRIAENDGLLAKHVATAEGTTYKEALEAIHIAVKNWQRILRAGKKVNLAGVGRLFLDAEGTLQFNPAQDVNYNIHSYGLHIFRASALEREEKLKHSVNRALEKHAAKSQPNPTESSEASEGIKQLMHQNRRQISRWAAVLGPAIALGLVGSYLYTQQPDAVQQAAGYVQNVFVNQKNTVQESQKSYLLDNFSEENGPANGANEERPTGVTPPTEDLNKKGKEDEKPEAARSYGAFLHWNPEADAAKPKMGPEYKASPAMEIVKEAQEREISSEKEHLTEAAPAREKKAAPNELPAASYYQIIVGSFTQEANALSYKQSLEERGFAAYLTQENGHLRVALGKFARHSEARHQLLNLRQAITADAWINGAP
jgi:nucleoid DNA-binding protein/cell division septation protein DedD